MQTLQRPYSHYLEHSIQEPTTAYDLIRQIEKHFENEKGLEADVSNRAENPINRMISDHTQITSSLEAGIEKLKNEISSIETSLSQLNTKQAEKFATNQKRQANERAKLQQQIATLKTELSLKKISTEINQAHQERMSLFEQEIERLKNQKINEGNSSITPLESHVTQDLVEKLNKQDTKMSELQYKILQLKQKKERLVTSHEILSHQLTELKEVSHLLQSKIDYCEEQTAIYTDKIEQKQTLRDKTKTNYQAIQRSVKHLIETKKKYLEEVVTEEKQYAITQLNQIRENFRQELATNQQKLEENIVHIQHLSESILKNIEEKRTCHHEQKQTSQQNQIEEDLKTLTDYRSYINEGTFRIFNIYQQEYLYAASFAPFDKDRRRVFTWRKKNEAVSQGDWKLEQSSDGTFCLFNLAHGEYLYAADYALFDKDRRQVFTWRPGGRISQGKWQLIPQGNNTYLIYNKQHEEYLYAADFSPYDRDRRRVFTWRKKNKIVKQAYWKIIKIS